MLLIKIYAQIDVLTKFKYVNRYMFEILHAFVSVHTRSLGGMHLTDHFSPSSCSIPNGPHYARNDLKLFSINVDVSIYIFK